MTGLFQMPVTEIPKNGRVRRTPDPFIRPKKRKADSSNHFRLQMLEAKSSLSFPVH